ncbi:MAG: YqjD family protein, partial [Halomonas sp.]
SKDASGEMRDLRTRAEQRLKDTRHRLEARGERIYEDTRDSLTQQADACDRYVHEIPWTSIGIGAAAGVIIGMLIGRR